MDENKAAQSVFAGRNFRLVFFGALVSDLGAVLYSFAVSFYLLEISGNNAFLQGLYLAVSGAVLLLVTPVGGVLGDRYSKAKIMFVCDYLKGSLVIAATVLMLLFPSHRAHIAILFAVGVLGSAVSGIFSPAANALLPHIVEERQLQQANACFSLKGAMQSILGVVLAGILYAAMPVWLLFLIVGVCYLLSGVSEMFIRFEHAPSKERLTVRLALADMKEALVYLRSQGAIMALLSSILFINFFIAPFDGNFIPYFVKTDIARAPSYLFDGFLTPELWSSAFGMLVGISSLAGSVIMGAKEPEEKCGRKTALRLCAMAGIMLLLTAVYWLLVDRGRSLNAFLLLFCLGCLGIGYLVVCINIQLTTVIMRIVDRDKLSKVTSFISILTQGLIPIASVTAGAVLHGFGCTLLLLFCSAGFTAAALFLLCSSQARTI